jgi:hypothetical protein
MLLTVYHLVDERGNSHLTQHQLARRHGTVFLGNKTKSVYV